MKLRFGLLLATLAFAAAANAELIDIPRNTVLEATADQDLSLKNNREGDRVSITVQNDRDLPRGTRLWGEIARMEPSHRDRPGYMDVTFGTMELPNGQRVQISAIPVALNAKGITRDRDGRLVADPKKVKPDQAVIGGVVGGLIVGAILKKPFEGAFLGGLAGILIAESQKQEARQSEHLILKKGARLGALLEEDVRTEVDTRYDRNRRDDRYGNVDERDRRDDTRDRDRYEDRNRRGESMDIRCGDRAISFTRDRMPYREGREVYVPLSIARQMDLETDRRGDRIYVDGAESTLRLELGSRQYRLNGKRGELDSEIVEADGEIYVPLSLLAAISERPVTLNGNRVSN